MANKETGGTGKVNKSQAIRDFFSANPRADSKTVVAGLADKGVKVSPTMVYYIKSKLGHAKRRARRESLALSSRKSGAANPVEIVLRVKDLARDVGGVKHLKQLVDLLAE
jgi:hypothetical protein